MNGGRRLAVAVWLSACFHGPLVAAGLYRSAYDTATHEFLADHYAQAPFALWDPRWFTGFSVASYPPLVHQLLAIVGFVVGYDAAFGVLLLATLLVLPVAVWSFARIFVSGATAGTTAILSVFLPAVALTGHAFGQLPTLVALALALLAVFEWTRFVERGGRLRLALATTLVAVCFTAHHATPILFLPPAMLASLSTVLPAGARRQRLARAALGAVTCAAAGVLAVVPLWLWATVAPTQAFIPHLSRENFLMDLDAQLLFFWAMYGVLPALALLGARAADARAWRCALLGAAFGLIGLGGTTLLPALLFGERWQWLTYDRFALWAAVALLPGAGLAVDRAVAARTIIGRAAVAVALVALAAFAGVAAASSLLAGPPQEPDPHPIANFLNTGDRADWRFQTFGLGEASVRLGILTGATTIDGAYFTARRVGELASSGIGMLDYALWWEPTGTTLRRVLARADAYSIRWAFVADPTYDPYLAEAGFHRSASLEEGIVVWEKDGVPPLALEARRFGEPDVVGILWGTLPLGLLTAAVGLAIVRHHASRHLREWRRIARWMLSRRVWERSLSL